MPTGDLKKILLRSMLRIRLVEERIVALYPEQEMRCPTHLSIGQEAVSAGLCAALQKNDLLFGTYRSHGIYIARDASLKKMFAELYGKKTGTSRGKAGSMLLAAPENGLLLTSAIVGGSIPIATGAAFSMQLQKKHVVTCVLFGDGATEEGVFHESLNFASLRKLPVVFICENNFYAVHTHLNKRQCADNIFRHAEPYQIPGIRGDGNDVLDVFQKTKDAIDRARSGDGPSLLEFRTYRWLEHVGVYSDTDLGYRPPEEVESWIKRCPIQSHQKKCLDDGVLQEKDIQQMHLELNNEIDEAVAFAKNSPFPDPEDVTVGVYVP